uniref:Uncharacterized protein n=1 Tax=Aegilops tauschii TaxID=37682 RepID=M8BF28_AEGTA
MGDEEGCCGRDYNLIEACVGRNTQGTHLVRACVMIHMGALRVGANDNGNGYTAPPESVLLSPLRDIINWCTNMGISIMSGMMKTNLDVCKQSPPGSNNLFRFKTDRSSAPSSPFAEKLDCAGGAGSPTPKKAPRKVPKTPHKVLDAPSLQDDFYLNLVDWSSQNMLAVGLGTCVYLWSASSSKIANGTVIQVTKLCDLGPRDSVCAVHWTREGSYLAVGTSLGDVQIWDSSRCKRIRNMGGHQTRAGVLAWNSTILSSGSRDKNILQHDIRVPTDYISKFSGHRSEVRLLLPLTCIAHYKASRSCVTLGFLKLFLNVCNLAWCKNVNELVSTHGYSQNQIMVWKYPSMSKTIVTGAGDETLRFWNIFPSMKAQAPARDAGLFSFSRSHIRFYILSRLMLHHLYLCLRVYIKFIDSVAVGLCRT